MITELPDTGIMEMPDVPLENLMRPERQAGLRKQLEQVRGENKLARIGSSVLPTVEKIVQPLSNPIGMAVNLPFQAGQALGLVPQEQPLPIQPHQPLFGTLENPIQGEGAMAGVGQLGTDLFNTLTTGEMISTLPAFGGGGIVPQVAKAGFALPMAQALPEQVAKAGTVLGGDYTPKEKVIAAGEPAIGAGFLGLLSKMPEGVKPSGIKSEQIESPGLRSLTEVFNLPEKPKQLTQGTRFEGQEKGPPTDFRNPLLPEGFKLPEENTPEQMAARAEEALSGEEPTTSQVGGEVSLASPSDLRASNAQVGSLPFALQEEGLRRQSPELEAEFQKRNKPTQGIEAMRAEFAKSPEFQAALEARRKAKGLDVKGALEKNQGGEEASVGLHLIDPEEWKKLGFKVGAKVDALQLGNRLKNVLGEKSFQWDVIKDLLPKSGKLTSDEAQKLVNETGPQVRVESYGMEGNDKVTTQTQQIIEAERAYNTATHLVDTQGFERVMDDGPFFGALRERKTGDVLVKQGDQIYIYDKDNKFIRQEPIANQTENVGRYFNSKEVYESFGKEEPVGNQVRATSAYTSVSALPTEEKMPEWTATKSGKNVQRVDVVLPQINTRESRGAAIIAAKTGKEVEGVLWSPDNLHEQLPNTLGWAMIQYKTGSKGEKIAVVNEVQSRWGQQLRESGKQFGTTNPNIRHSVVPEHPLLHDYNRLILKAAIDQARKEGATHIFISDAESAMMTEGHDLLTQDTLGHGIERGKIAQEPGMRLNYDTMLPRIAEELTGAKGEKVSLGEHKNAFRTNADQTGSGYNTALNNREALRRSQRKGLIFRNPDGSPKTDISGTLYPIKGAKEDFSTLSKDKAAQGEKPRGLQVGKGLDKPREEGGGQLHQMVGEQIEKAYEGTKEYASKIKDYLKGAEDTPLKDFMLDASRPLPQMMPKEKANEVFSQPFASEKVPVLGRLMGGKARIRTDVDKVLAAWYAERHGVAQAVAASLGENIRGKISSAFATSKEGDLNVKPSKVGQSLKTSDVFENLRRDPNSYELTERQRLVYDKLIAPIVKRMSQLANQYKVVDDIVDASGDFRPYFPRIVTKHPKIEEGLRTNAAKERAFKSEQEGWQKGYEYERDVEKRLVSGTQRLYTAIANKRLAEDPILNARTPEGLKAELQEFYSEEIGSDQMTQAKIDRIANGIMLHGRVNQPILMSKIYSPEVAKALNREFAAEASTFRRSISDVNSTIKALQLGFDFGVGQIQEMLLAGFAPKVWAKSQYESFKSFASPKFFSAYVRKHAESVNELAQLGVSVGRPQEFMSGLSERGLIPKVPGVKQAAAAFGRQFQTALDVAKVELWEAWKPTMPKEEWPKLARTIESLLLTERQEANMVPHGRALNERVFLLASAYYRGAVNLVAALGESGASGKQVRHSVGKALLAGGLIYYGVGKGLGMSDDELKERLDPRNSNFLSWKVKSGNRVVNLGFGGIYRSFLRLAGNIVKTSQDHPENWKSLSPDKNPLTRWYRGHAGPLVSLSWDGFSGRDFLDRETDVVDLGKRVVPLIAQQGMQREEEGKATPIEYVGSAVGLTATPESRSAAKLRLSEESAQEKYKKPFKQLKIGERLRLVPEVDKKLQDVPGGMTKARQEQLALTFANERLERLQKDVGQDALLKEKGLKLSNYTTRHLIGGKALPLDKEELETLHINMVEEYKKQLDRVKERKVTQEAFGSLLERARQIAWAKTLRSISTQKKETAGTTK